MTDKSEVNETEDAGDNMPTRVIRKISQMFQSFVGHLTPFKERVPPALQHRGSKSREQFVENLYEKHENRVLDDSNNISVFNEEDLNICDDTCEECAAKRQGD